MVDKSLELAAKRLRVAEESFMDELRNAYPIGSQVRVVHSHGVYYGTVTGHSFHGKTVRICNDVTHKTSERWYIEVERATS